MELGPFYSTDVVKLLSKLLNWSKSYRPLQRMPVTYNLFSLPSTKRMEVSTVFLTRIMSVNSLALWVLRLLAEPT